MSTTKRSYLPRKAWTEEEIEIIRVSYPNEDTAVLAAGFGVQVRHIYYQVQKLGIVKSQEYLATLSRQATERVLVTGVNTRFKAGHEPLNNVARIRLIETKRGIARVKKVTGGTVTTHRMR